LTLCGGTTMRQCSAYAGSLCPILRTWHGTSPCPRFTDMTSCTSGGSDRRRSRSASHWCEASQITMFETLSIGGMHFMQPAQSVLAEHAAAKDLRRRGGGGEKREGGR